MNPLKTEFALAFMRMAHDGWLQGWHECNGGNLSYRLRSREVAQVKDAFKPKKWQPLGVDVPELGGGFFMITAAGSFFRNIELRPKECLGIIELDAYGKRFRKCWGFVQGDKDPPTGQASGRPTSELPSHMLIHAAKLRSDKLRSDKLHSTELHPTDLDSAKLHSTELHPTKLHPANLHSTEPYPTESHSTKMEAARVVYHAHPTYTAALTHILPRDARIDVSHSFSQNNVGDWGNSKGPSESNAKLRDSVTKLGGSDAVPRGSVAALGEDSAGTEGNAAALGKNAAGLGESDATTHSDDSNAYTKALTDMLSEFAIVFPDGIGVLPRMQPGTVELGRATAEQMRLYDAVIWAAHGVIACAPTFDQAFGFVHTIEKAAHIHSIVNSVGESRVNAVGEFR